MRCSRFQTVVLLLVSWWAGQIGLRAAESAAPASAGGNAPGMKGVVYGFFDDKTGARIGRLEIESVGIEYQRRGFLRGVRSGRGRRGADAFDGCHLTRAR